MAKYTVWTWSISAWEKLTVLLDRFRLCDVFDHSFSNNHIVGKYCEKVCNESRIVAA